MFENKKCFVCKKKLNSFEGVFMLGLDRPYVNLWFHKVCFNEIDNLLSYLKSKTEEISKEIPKYG